MWLFEHHNSPCDTSPWTTHWRRCTLARGQGGDVTHFLTISFGPLSDPGAHGCSCSLLYPCLRLCPSVPIFSFHVSVLCRPEWAATNPHKIGLGRKFIPDVRDFHRFMFPWWPNIFLEEGQHGLRDPQWSSPAAILLDQKFPTIARVAVEPLHLLSPHASYRVFSNVSWYEKARCPCQCGVFCVPHLTLRHLSLRVFHLPFGTFACVLHGAPLWLCVFH